MDLLTCRSTAAPKVEQPAMGSSRLWEASNQCSDRHFLNKCMLKHNSVSN